MLAEAPQAVSLPHIRHCHRHVGKRNGTEHGPGQPLGPAARPGAGLGRLWSEQEPAPAPRSRPDLCRASAALHGPSRPHPLFPHPPQVKRGPAKAGNGPGPSQLTAECRSTAVQAVRASRSTCSHSSFL